MGSKRKTSDEFHNDFNPCFALEKQTSAPHGSNRVTGSVRPPILPRDLTHWVIGVVYSPAPDAGPAPVHTWKRRRVYRDGAIPHFSLATAIQGTFADFKNSRKHPAVSTCQCAIHIYEDTMNGLEHKTSMLTISSDGVERNTGGNIRRSGNAGQSSPSSRRGCYQHYGMVNSDMPNKNLRLPLGEVYSTEYPLGDCDDTAVGCDEIDKDPAGFVRVALLPYLRLVSRLVQKPSGLAGNFRPGPVRPIFR